jgi:hypothetical protein
MKNVDFWDVAPCRSCVNRRFGGKYRIHRRVENPASEEPAWAGGCRFTLVPRSRGFLPCRWMWYFLPKRRFTQGLHGVTSQKTPPWKPQILRPSGNALIIVNSYERTDWANLMGAPWGCQHASKRNILYFQLMFFLSVRTVEPVKGKGANVPVLI